MLITAAYTAMAKPSADYHEAASKVGLTFFNSPSTSAIIIDSALKHVMHNGVTVYSTP